MAKRRRPFRESTTFRILVVLFVISFILLAHFSGAPPNSTYIPAHIENGKFVPGVEK